MLRIILTILLMMLLGVYPVRAEIWTSGHYEIVEGNVYGEIDIYNDVTVDILGGDIFRLAAFDVTVTDWFGGQMDTLWARDNSIVNIYGGTLGDLLWAKDNSIVNIYGGIPGDLGAAENSLINLYAYDVVITYTGGYWDDGQVTGKYYADDNSFIFDLWGQNTYSHIAIVPEPGTLLLFGLGGLLLRKRSR